jgi:ABC-type transport system involved in cytochrome c biogenesis permease subunit
MHFVALMLQEQPDPEVVKRAMLAMFAILPVVCLVGLAILILPFWFILKKAGFSPWLSLINMVPFGTLILLYVMAFSDWKVVPAPEVGWMPPPTTPPPGV